MITMKQVTALVNSSQRQHDLEQQRKQRRIGTNEAIPEYIKQVASHVFNELTTMRPGWKVGFSHGGQLDAKQVTAYKIQLLKAMQENKIDSIEMVEAGLKRLRAERGQFLPSIGDFVSACQMKSKGELNAGMYRLFKPEQLIASFTEQERKQIGKQKIAEIRKLLEKR